MKRSEIVQIVKEVLEEESKGLWANINAKHKRGEKPSRKGSKAWKAAVEAGKEILAMKEMNSSELDSVERYADAELSPIDVEFGNHFFDRLNDPRNGKEITSDELVSFFDRLAKKKDAFINFIKKYHEFVVKDRNSNINIPFVSQVNQALAKTIMRKPGFMTPDPTIALEEGIDNPVQPGILKDRLGKLTCTKVRAAHSKLEDKGTHYGKALQRYLNYHCK
jgi:hypothetical protein